MRASLCTCYTVALSQKLHEEKCGVVDLVGHLNLWRAKIQGLSWPINVAHSGLSSNRDPRSCLSISHSRTHSLLQSTHLRSCKANPKHNVYPRRFQIKDKELSTSFGNRHLLSTFEPIRVVFAFTLLIQRS